jgi:hypothetical protein
MDRTRPTDNQSRAQTIKADIAMMPLVDLIAGDSVAITMGG